MHCIECYLLTFALDDQDPIKRSQSVQSGAFEASHRGSERRFRHLASRGASGMSQCECAMPSGKHQDGYSSRHPSPSPRCPKAVVDHRRPSPFLDSRLTFGRPKLRLRCRLRLGEMARWRRYQRSVSIKAQTSHQFLEYRKIHPHLATSIPQVSALHAL